MKDMVIPDVMNDVFLPQGRYPENFMLISQWKVCQEGVIKKRVLGGHLGFLTGVMDNRIFPDVMNDVLLP